MTVIDEYLNSVPAGQKAEVERIRSLVKEQLPEAEDIISFRVPAFRYKKKTLLWVGVFKHHMSLVPGHIKFTEAEPLPDALVKDYIRQQVERIDAGKVKKG